MSSMHSAGGGLQATGLDDARFVSEYSQVGDDVRHQVWAVRERSGRAS